MQFYNCIMFDCLLCVRFIFSVCTWKIFEKPDKFLVFAHFVVCTESRPYGHYGLFTSRCWVCSFLCQVWAAAAAIISRNRHARTHTHTCTHAHRGVFMAFEDITLILIQETYSNNNCYQPNPKSYLKHHRKQPRPWCVMIHIMGTWIDAALKHIISPQKDIYYQECSHKSIIAVLF